MKEDKNRPQWCKFHFIWSSTAAVVDSNLRRNS